MITGIIGAVIGFGLVLLLERIRHSPQVNADESSNFEGAERKLRRRMAGRHRHRLGRRRSELSRRSRKVKQLEERVVRAHIDEDEAEAFELARAAFEANQRRHQSLKDRRKHFKRRLETLEGAFQEALAQQAEADPKVLLEQLEESLVDEYQKRSEKIVRQSAQRLESQQERRAREIIHSCAERYADSHFAPRLSTGFRCEKAARGADLLAWSDTLKEARSMEIVASEREGFYSVKGADPWWKEAVRRLAEDLVSGGDLPTGDQLERRLNAISRTMKSVASRCSERSIKALKTGPVEGERRRLLDRLRFRTSYRQNQWRHASEVGFLSGMICWEVGLDGPVGRRGGLLHDIGKSLTHDTEGGHAVLGAEVARAEDEHPGVASCIGSHHGDEPPLGLEPYVVAAGDAISGARPGARYQMGEHHEQRLRELDRITKSPRIVDDAYAVHGGREVRVILHTEDRQGRPIRTSEKQMQTLARSMADQIEAEMEYPGSINVTLIRRVVAQSRAR
jgi:ribonuclease Y